MRRDSISSISSSASEDEETIQIFVKDIAGNTTPLTLPPSTTIATLTTLLALRFNLPESDLRLLHTGHHLPATATLLSANLSTHSTLNLHLPLRGGMASTTTTPAVAARRKNLCAYSTAKTVASTDPDTGAVTSSKKQTRCREQAQRIVGECGFCAGVFCSKHRLLEAHECPGLEDCKSQDRARNASKLESERTVAIRGV